MSLFEKYWHISDKPHAAKGYAWIYCPAMDETGHSVSAKVEGVRELKRLEKHIVDIGLRGWVAAVDLDSPHVMRWAARVGARPFELNVAESRLWFVKNLDQGGWENV